MSEGLICECGYAGPFPHQCSAQQRFGSLPRATFDYGNAVTRPESDPDHIQTLVQAALEAVRSHQVALCPQLSRTAHKVAGRHLSAALNHLKQAEIALEAYGNPDN